MRRHQMIWMEDGEVVDEVGSEVILPPSSKAWTRHDTQGSVEVSMTPLNINASGGETLDIEILMNTHSDDLSMDLASLSTIETNLGEQLHPLSWSGGSGHHVRGILLFPAQSSIGNFFLDGASNFTLIIRNVDVPEREFAREVSGSE